MKTLENMITPTDLAREKGVSRQAVASAVERGTLTAVRVGRTVLIVRDEALDAYLERPSRPGLATDADEAAAGPREAA